jgi:hypothetical protein
MKIGKDHTIKVIAATVAKELEKAVTEWLKQGIPSDLLGQVGDAEKFDLQIQVAPAGKDANKLGLLHSATVPILKSLVR